MPPILAFEFSARFKREYKSAPPDIQDLVDQCLEDLQTNSRSHRAHRLQGFKPTAYVADVKSNHSWQMTFEMIGQTAHLKRLASHTEITRSPG